MLLEREKELALLGDLAERLGDAGGKVVLIRGEAGIGKSSLVRAFLASIESLAHVHVGFCDDLQTPQPFGPLWDIARDNPHLQAALQASDRQEVLHAFFDLLTGTLRPNVVVVEDTQWTDEATLDAIKYSGRRIARTNGLLVLTYRDEEVDLDDPLRAVLGSLPAEYVERVELAGLSREAVAEIVAGSGLDADRVLEATRGNPFFVTEMALTAADEVPASVRDSVMARVGRLSILTREMLRYMSVIPERTSRSELNSLIGDVGSHLAECERLGLLDVGTETVAFRHELIRRAVEASLTTSEATTIHRALLDVLPDETDPARLVHHARGASDVDRLIELVPRAAQAAAWVGGHREASAHYRTLEPYLDRMPEIERASVLFAWAQIEYYLGQVDAVEILDRAIDLYRSSGAKEDIARALTLAITVNEAHARTSKAETHALEVIRLLEPDGASSELADALARYTDLLIHQGEGRKVDEVAERAIAMGRETGNERAQITALYVKGMLSHVRGVPGALSLIEEARSRAQEAGHRFEEVLALRGAAYTSQEINDLHLERDFARRARETAIRYEFPLLEVEANAVLVDALMRSGSWTEAEDLATENLGSHANADVHFLRVLGLLRLRTGRSGAREYLDRAWALAQRSTEIDYLQHVAACLVEEMWLEGQVFTELTNGFRDLVVRGIEYEFPWLAGWLAFWLWRVGEIGNTPDGIPEPHTLAIHGRIAQAAAFWEAREMPYERAMALSCGDQAQRLAALEILDTLGAEAVSAKVRKGLRDEGVAVPRGRGRATREHAAGLTARQADVLQLLAQGMTNPEIADRLFLSRRTVENHVSAVLAKLSSSSRQEAVAKARSEGLL